MMDVEENYNYFLLEDEVNSLDNESLVDECAWLNELSIKDKKVDTIVTSYLKDKKLTDKNAQYLRNYYILVSCPPGIKV